MTVYVLYSFLDGSKTVEGVFSSLDKLKDVANNFDYYEYENFQLDRFEE